MARNIDAIHQSASRNADEINAARLEMCEPIEAWGAQKHDQLALIRDQIIEVRERILSGDLTASQEGRWRTLLLKAVHQLAEQTGQLPLRAAEVAAKEFAKHIRIGVDVDRAFPPPGSYGAGLCGPVRMGETWSRIG